MPKFGLFSSTNNIHHIFLIRLHVEITSKMNNMSECEARLLKLKRYLPFLHRTKEYLASSPGESLKITHLIDIISNAGEQ